MRKIRVSSNRPSHTEGNLSISGWRGLGVLLKCCTMRPDNFLHNSAGHAAVEAVLKSPLDVAPFNLACMFVRGCNGPLWSPSFVKFGSPMVMISSMPSKFVRSRVGFL